MGNYFINVSRGNHGGGTKFYDIYSLCSEANGKNATVLIQNWGKTSGATRLGVFKLPGQYKIEKCHRKDVADADFTGIKVSKERRGYSFEDPVNIYAVEYKDHFVEKLKKFGLDSGHLLEICEFLIPDFSPEIIVDTDNVAKKAQEKTTAPKPVFNDPLWGTW